MIPLRLKVSGDLGNVPFIARLTDRDFATDSRDATRIGDSVKGVDFSSRQGIVTFLGASAIEIIGDVLLIDPRKQIAHRLIRGQSVHNTLLVTEQCDQLCLMCSQPPKQHHEDLFSYFKEAVELAPDRSVIGISGGEPLLYKDELRGLIEHSRSRRPDVRFHILTNAQHFENSDHSWLKNCSSVLWGVPIYSSDSRLHDEIVGKEGAFIRLRNSLAVLARAGADIELRTVVMQPNVGNMEALADFLSRSMPFISFWAIMQLERIGFGRQLWKELFYDSGKDFSLIAKAVEIAGTRGIKTSLYNFPLCTIPEPFRQFSVASISDWKRKYLESCQDCLCKNTCGGFFEWYSADQGFTGVARL